MVRASGLLVVGVVAVLLAGCGGGGGDKTFDVDQIGVTFRYSSKFHPIKNITFQATAGSRAAARGGVALDAVNAIIVSRYDLKRTITKANLAKYKGEVDRVIGQLAGKPESGLRVEYGGLPGYEYVISIKSPPNGRSRMAVLFDRATEYLVNCQSTPAKRDEIEQGCRKALDTLATK